VSFRGEATTVQARRRHPFNRGAVLLLAILVGALAGFAVGRQSILHTNHSRLSAYANRLEEHQEEITREVAATLRQVNASRQPPCSAEGIALLRRLTFAARFLKDVGRTQDNALVCSATSGKLTAPIPMLKPDIQGPRGSVIYRSFQLNLSAGDRADVVAHLNSEVVLSPDNFAEYSQEPIHYATGFTDRTKGIVYGSRRQEFAFPTAVLQTNQVLQRADTLYLARCSARFPVCSVTYIRTHEIWQANRMLLAGYITTGTIAGVLCGAALLMAGRKRRSHSSQLRRAILMGNLSVAYQPIVELETRRIIGAEALARWTDEDGDSIRPEIIISLAEAEGFVSEITRFVVTRSLQELRPLLEKNPKFRLSINLAPSDLADPRLLLLLDESLNNSTIAPQNIAFELTERATSDTEVAAASIRRLRDRGHTVYIDDFGTGYSNLAFLSELNVDGIKINRSFIATIGTESVTASIIPQILAVAEALNLEVVVQGIEREQQADYFAACNQRILGQGWFFGMPVPAKSLIYLCSEKAE
jgi:sensor c-di-GMP phosphodiesterase-like protein